MNRKELHDTLNEAIWFINDSYAELEEICEDNIQASKALEYNGQAAELIEGVFPEIRIHPRRRHH